MHRDKIAKVAIWQNLATFAILALLLLCINFKNSFGQMTSLWILWKSYYILLLKKSLWSRPKPSMCLSERINWIISSFSHRISKILFVLGSEDDFGSLARRIGEGPSFYVSILFLGSMQCSQHIERLLCVSCVRISTTLPVHCTLHFWVFKSQNTTFHFLKV